MTTVLLVDDQPLVRTGLRALLEPEPDLEVVGEAANGEEAVTLTAELQPDVVLMDVRMPVLDGIEATRRICASGRSQVLVLTTFDVDEHVYDALRAGAAGFLLKDAERSDLVRAVRAVADGQQVLAPSVTRRLVEAVVRRPGRSSEVGLPQLTQREQEVLREVAKGSSNEEVATALYLGEATVRTHVSAVLQKLGVRNRVQAVIVAYETGLVRPGEP